MSRNTRRTARLIYAASVAVCAAAPTATAQTTIPLREGLTVVTAVADPRGDFESIKRVSSMDAKILRIDFSTDMPPADESSPIAMLLGGGGCGGSNGGASGPNRKPITTGIRQQRREDLESAHEYRYYFRTCGNNVETFPRSTAIGMSASALRELRAKGETRLSIPPVSGAANLMAGLASLIGGGASPQQSGVESGDLVRVEPADVAFKTIVNDEPTELRAIHARGRFGDDTDAEFWILDDEANPLSLKWNIGDQRLQVIKISFPAPAGSADASAGSPTSGHGTPAPSGAEKIERDLPATGRAVVYGIYFDFASDRIKPESEPVLGEIATALDRNPTWKLTVEGHTDNIGGDPYNVDLSKRRAAAVKQALVGRYHVSPERLVTNGFGASRPKDTNATLEGRARNRRVELVKAG